MIIQKHPGPVGQVFFRDNAPEGHDNPAYFDALKQCLFPYRLERENRGWSVTAQYVTDYSSVDYDVTTEGDEVEVMRGDFAGEEGEVLNVDLKDAEVHVEGGDIHVSIREAAHEHCDGLDVSERRVIDNLEASNRKVLLLTKGGSATLYRSCRNLPRVNVMDAASVSTLDVLDSRLVLVQEGALEVLTGLLTRTQKTEAA